jgi:hypothetical protein
MKSNGIRIYTQISGVEMRVQKHSLTFTLSDFPQSIKITQWGKIVFSKKYWHMKRLKLNPLPHTILKN